LDGLRATKAAPAKQKLVKTAIADPEVRMAAADRILKVMGQVPAPQDYPKPPAPPCIIHIHPESARPVEQPGAMPSGSSASPNVGPAGSGRPVVQQQAVIINVHPERDRPR
jgi:hypothetical protein